jgi:MerR family transcriptional regulator, copper efflux regulator
VGTYRISQFVGRTGVPATTLRFYEKEGLLAAARTAAGYRTYTDDDAERVRFIGAAKGLGLSLARIRALLAVRDGGLCREVRDELRGLVADRIADTEHRIDELHAFREHLDRASARLRGLPAEDGPCGPACADLHATPVACSLDADGYDARIAHWAEQLGDADRRPVPGGGVTVRLPADRIAAVAELVLAEQACCPFLTFRLDLAGSHLDLTVRAPAGAGVVVDDLLARSS